MIETSFTSMAINAVREQENNDQLQLHHDLYKVLPKYDDELEIVNYSGIMYKDASEDCGVSVDGHAKGNGWKIRLSWDNETYVLWSPNLKNLLNAVLQLVSSGNEDQSKESRSY